MRIVSLLVAFCFSFNVLASSGTIQELERHMDDYYYSLSVEWDQEDQAFYEAKTKAFFDKMNDLIAEGNLSQNDILRMVEAKSKNKAAVDALKLKISLLPKDLSPEQLANIVKENAKNLYSEGASWNGEVVFSVVLGIVLIGALAYSIWWDANHKCAEYETRYVCNQVSSCYYTGAPSTGYHYDMYGNWVTPGYTCYGFPQTVCGDTNVCVRYEKK